MEVEIAVGVCLNAVLMKINWHQALFVQKWSNDLSFSSLTQRTGSISRFLSLFLQLIVRFRLLLCVFAHLSKHM